MENLTKKMRMKSMINLFNITDFFQYEFLLYAAICIILLAISTGAISPFIIARKNSFMGPAISHSTFLGLSISMALFHEEQGLSIFFTTLFITIVIGLILAKATYKESLPPDSLIGVFFSTTMAFGIIVHQKLANTGSNLESILFGNIILVNKHDILLGLVITLITTFSIFYPFKKWIYITYDELSAQIAGLRPKLFHYLFFFLMILVIVSGLKMAGAILINTLLLIPGLFALKMAKNMKQVMIYSISFSIITSILGLIIANYLEITPGATIGAFQFIIFSLLKIKSMTKKLQV